MERRLLYAIVLMIGVMILSNVLFPPVERPLEPTTEAADEPADVTPDPSGAEPELSAGDQAAEELEAALAEPETVDVGDPAPVPEPEAAQIVTVRSALYEYRFDTRGARLVGATMRDFENFAEEGHTAPNVELVRPDDAILTYGVSLRGETVSLESVVFAASSTQVDVTDGPGELRFEAPIGRLTFDVTYRFHPDDYRFEVSGGLRGLGDVGHAILIGLGRGIEFNEAVTREDRDAMGLVTRSRSGEITAERLSGVEDDEAIPTEGGPFTWVASKSKYWLAALITPPGSPGVGGVILRGVPEDAAGAMQASLPIPAGSEGFEYAAYVGPQDFERLRAVGQELHNVNPMGWSWLRWFIRPFGNLIVTILIWMHESFALSYGWVLIVFGVASRIVLFPLYQISMRQQMKQMAMQPEMKKIQQRYKGDPQRMQQEQVKLYREHGVNPVGGCLPMLVPLPILLTLFFVFQNTIEFRGVPFLWLPDLSLRDPLYIVPALMGGSMLLLGWISQRGMETNPQMKLLAYVMPVVFTFFLATFAAGLNLYYTASNFASLPQQLYLTRERRKAQSAGAGKDAAAKPGLGARPKR